MEVQRVRRAATVCAVAILFLTGGTAATQPELTVRQIVDVSAFVGVPSFATALNELGTVVGARVPPYGDWHAFKWSAVEGLSDLGVGAAFGVNDRNEVAGAANWSTVPQARVWTDTGGQNVANGIAYSINNRTEVVGYHIPPNTIYHAFRWSPASGLEDVESLTGFVDPWSYWPPFSEARFIRDDGVMAGWRGQSAVVWQPDGHFVAPGDGVANSVSDLGVIVGATSLSDGQAVVWQNSSATILSEQGGEAMDVNAAGYVVGWLSVAGERHGFVWHETRGLYDLGAGDARNIDELGNIAGSRGRTYSETRATVWHVDMTVGEYLLGFQTLAQRLLAEVGQPDAHRISQAIASAEHALAHSHSNDKAAWRHLERALAIIARLRDSGELGSERASALITTGRWIAARF